MCPPARSVIKLSTEEEMKRKIAVIGKGNVGGALEAGLSRAGYETKMVGRGAGVTEAAAWGDIIILAVPFSAVESVLAEIGTLARGKTIVDVTNALGPNGQLALGFSTSGAEQLQKKRRPRVWSRPSMPSLPRT